MKIAIIGTSGSGKSTASKFFEQKGFTVINLDLVAKWAVSFCPKLREELKEEFGNVFDGNVLNRKTLGAIAFTDKEKLKVLTSIFKPYIKEYVENLINTNPGANIVIDGYNFPEYVKFDMIIGIKADLDIAVERLLKREPHNSTELLRDRIIHQAVPYDLCDWIEDNNGTEEKLIKELSNLYFHIF